MNSEQVQEIFVEDIIPNRFQPRLTFDEKALQELSDSIKVHGVIQPLVLRRVGNKYEIIAGERRYKASCLAGLKKVPAIVRELTDNESAEIALIENIQRKNLSSIEEAQSYKNLLERGYLTQDELAKKLGVSQPAIANKLRLLNLCDEVQEALLNEQISERHARSLLQIENPDEQKNMLKRIVKERLTVKQLDNEIKKMKSGGQSNSDESTGGMAMEPNNDVTNNSAVENNTKNLFGFSYVTPTDMEKTAPNLAVSEEEFVPPVSFNPFANNLGPQVEMTQENNISNPIESVKTEPELETFDIFGDTIKDEIPVSVPGLDDGSLEDINPSNNPVGGRNIGDQITNIRNVIKTVEGNGYRVEMEEYDFEDMYQIVIKLKK